MHRRTWGVMSLVVLTITAMANSDERRTQDVWLDVDTATGAGGDVDDGLMLIQAFHSPELHIRGVSVVYGNAPLELAEPIARDIVARFGPPDLKVYRGAASKDESGRTTDAVTAMAAALKERPLTIMAAGPVTNVATLVADYPDLHARIQRIVVVAGRRPHQRFASGPVSFPDFNFEHDPAGMKVLLDSQIPMTFAPWEVSSKVWINRADLAALRKSGPAGEWIADTSDAWIRWWEERVGPWGFNPFDTLAVGWLTHPQLIETMTVSARIEIRPDDTASLDERKAGRSKPHLLVQPASPPRLQYAFRPRAAFKRVLLDRLAGRTVTGSDGASERSDGVHHAGLDELLRRFVDSDGRVDYRGLSGERSRLEAYVEHLATVKLEALTRDEELALLVNAYNACTLKLIVEHDPVRSIMDIAEEQRWKDRRWKIGGSTLSLDDIEHVRIRPRFGEPRIHFALVCAARDCPPLRNEAYEATRLDEQLEDQARRVHAHPRFVVLSPDQAQVRLTSLYQWYGGDFTADEVSIVRYVARYVPELQKLLADGREPNVSWLEYDWLLNEAR